MPTFTPPGLVFDEPTHVYTLPDVPLISVTRALAEASLIDRGLFTDADRERGSRIHAALELFHEQQTIVDDEDVAPFVVEYRAFLRATDFRIAAVEERLADPGLHVAGRLDLRGWFGDEPGRVDVIDIKTGSVPSWCGYQTAGYVRLLPVDVRPRCRRWCLQLRAGEPYRLVPLTKRSDEAVFLAACTVAMAKRGWL